MTAQTIEDLAAANGWGVIDLVWDEPQRIMCRGVGCNCRSYVRYDHIAGWDYCVCKHSSGTHKKPAPAKKAVKR